MYEDWKVGSKIFIILYSVFIYIKNLRKFKVKQLEFVIEFSRGIVFEINI